MSKTTRSLDGRLILHIEDKAPSEPWHLWHVKHDEILPGYLIYVRLDPNREYDWMMSIDENSVIAVKR